MIFLEMRINNRLDEVMGLIKQALPSSGSNEALHTSQDSFQDAQSKKRLIHQKASLCKYVEDVDEYEEEDRRDNGDDGCVHGAEREETEEDVEELEELDECIAVKQSLLSSEQRKERKRSKEISPVPSIEKIPGTPPPLVPTSSTKTIVRSSGIFPSRFMSSKVRGGSTLKSTGKQKTDSMQESPREYSELTTTYDYDELKSSTLSTDEDELLTRDPTTSHSLSLTVVSTNLNRTKSLQLPEPDSSEERGVLRQTLSDSKDTDDWDPGKEPKDPRESKDDDGCT